MSILNIKDKVQNIINLPSLPSITLEVIKLIDNEDTNIHTLSKIISKDQVLASKVLKVANSPFYSYPRSISTVDFAVTVLGFETVKEITFSISLISHFKKYLHSDFDINKFWGHSIIASVICRELAKEISYKIPGEAFVAGLIHDIGIFVMSQFFPADFKNLMTMLEGGEYELQICEKEIFDATHAEIGAWLFERWNFPVQLYEAVRYHHKPEITSINPQLSALVYYTDYLIKGNDMNPFLYDSFTGFSSDFLPILTFEDISSLELFYKKNKTLFSNEVEKVQYLF